ncbi:MAG: phage protein Gp27 family protein [Pseudomonadota bacterium]
MSAAANQRGRGRLSSIDLLPDEAEPAIVWALDALRERKLPASTILIEFNERLADISHEAGLDPAIEPISKSAFNRYSIRKAKQFRRLDEAQKLGRELVGAMKPENPDDVTIAVAELLKVAMFEILEKDEPSSKEIMEMSRALQSAVNAQKGSAEYRERLQRELQAKLAEAARKVGELAEKNGVSESAMAQINQAITGGAG